jgi:hypothetical protein
VGEQHECSILVGSEADELGRANVGRFYSFDLGNYRDDGDPGFDLLELLEKVGDLNASRERREWMSGSKVEVVRRGPLGMAMALLTKAAGMPKDREESDVTTFGFSGGGSCRSWVVEEHVGRVRRARVVNVIKDKISAAEVLAILGQLERF